MLPTPRQEEEACQQSILPAGSRCNRVANRPVALRVVQPQLHAAGRCGRGLDPH